MKMPSITGLLKLLAVIAVISHFPTHAYSDLSITPSQVRLDASSNSVSMQLQNVGSIEQTYRIEWRELTPDEAAQRQPAPPGETRRASHLVRFSPRQVTLAPGESQTVRLIVQRPSDLASGDYRSYLRFVGQPVARELLQDGAPPEQDIAINFAMAFAIPVIVAND